MYISTYLLYQTNLTQNPHKNFEYYYIKSLIRKLLHLVSIILLHAHLLFNRRRMNGHSNTSQYFKPQEIRLCLPRRCEKVIELRIIIKKINIRTAITILNPSHLIISFRFLSDFFFICSLTFSLPLIHYFCLVLLIIYLFLIFYTAFSMFFVPFLSFPDLFSVIFDILFVSITDILLFVFILFFNSVLFYLLSDSYIFLSVR